MSRTPAPPLEARARDGHWLAFPVSPAPYHARLALLYRDAYFDYRGVGLFVSDLELAGDEMLAAASSEDERLAIGRALLQACIEAMEHADDSGDDLGSHFREREAQYLETVRPYLARPRILRDLLELVAWEDYGLFDRVHAFLGELPEAEADLAVRELAEILHELRAAQLDGPLATATRLRARVLARGSDGR